MQFSACNARAARRASACAAAVLVLCGCGIYTFSGSTLPPHLKTVDIPLFGNQSLQADVAEDLTEEINKEVLSSNLLRVVADNGDATISGTVLNYRHHPYTYGAEDFRDVNVTQYAVTISVTIEFLDNKKDEPLYKGTISGEGIYDLDTETEETGRQRALQEIVEQVLQNSVQSW
ncbi:MAG: hypothetical protein GF418_05900 [Chitinivibrionales bacterium]|nr:hypothetical protein [Chitinivibrionales bacterium]MBD3395144.1 hypothetical protein [Chitinivibrionales bacterium]